MSMDSMNALAALQALAAKSGSTADTKKTTEEQKSFNDVLAKMQKEQDEVEIAPGAQCDTPYRCWYYEYCHDV